MLRATIQNGAFPWIDGQQLKRRGSIPELDQFQNKIKPNMRASGIELG
jgi:hypothetical protein